MVAFQPLVNVDEKTAAPAPEQDTGIAAFWAGVVGFVVGATLVDKVVAVVDGAALVAAGGNTLLATHALKLELRAAFKS